MKRVNDVMWFQGQFLIFPHLNDLDEDDVNKYLEHLNTNTLSYGPIYDDSTL